LIDYRVVWYAGPYDGVRIVRAEDEDAAIEIVQAWVHEQMTQPLYAEGCGVECRYDIEECS